MLSGKSWFHISIPLGENEPRSLMTGNKQVTHWAIETVYECSEIAGSPQYVYLIFFIVPYHISESNKID
jgi:hypothetical protein